ncbi:hypothetical protein EG68_08706 [Paragonimus skrjabini miyazakii]|uniref:Uncharacterized protein n=1 Tax=Paragonimus skrjabini miyazakii TaxID=59628 RepID=A0A8S9YNY7_9TREM|nr:hypothetical protein EG68_08706 [Paragonimus skrjabini miyazakii]
MSSLRFLFILSIVHFYECGTWMMSRLTNLELSSLESIFSSSKVLSECKMQYPSLIRCTKLILHSGG